MNRTAKGCGAKTWSFPLSDQRKKEVEKIVMMLSMDERAVVYLKYWVGMGLRQIAKALGMEFFDVCAAHERAIVVMRQQLEKVQI